jgi:thymidylate synthase
MEKENARLKGATPVTPIEAEKCYNGAGRQQVVVTANIIDGQQQIISAAAAVAASPTSKAQKRAACQRVLFPNSSETKVDNTDHDLPSKTLGLHAENEAVVLDEQANKRAKRSLQDELKDPPSFCPDSWSENEATDSRSSSPETVNATVCETQDVDYSQDVKIPTSFDNGLTDRFFLEVSSSSVSKILPLDPEEIFCIGRDEDNDLVIPQEYPYVSGKHCCLSTAQGRVHLEVRSKKGKCYYRDPAKSTTELSELRREDGPVELNNSQSFLLAPPRATGDNSDMITLRLKHAQVFKAPLGETSGDKVAPKSFDEQYLNLLHRIEKDGSEQKNKKGDSVTLADTVQIVLDLNDDQDQEGLGRFLLPKFTLRWLYNYRPAVVEAMWYLQGSPSIKFLQENDCKFWDRQATAEGTVGLNYGLLTNYPLENGGSFNQLENVINKLADGQSSRNMDITLNKPGEETVQKACTSCIQFTVSSLQKDGKKRELLNMTIHQRSSDVILGLPHDVIVWSIIYHLVRREVSIRSRRILAGGKIHFNIAAGAAHIYKINEKDFRMLLKREPKSVDGQPELIVNRKPTVSMFDMADADRFEANMFRIEGYTSGQCHEAIKDLKQAVEQESSVS